jgi:hypothetical protein
MEHTTNEVTILTESSEPANFAEMVALSSELAKSKPILTLTANYLELEKSGESFRGIFIGWQDVVVTDKSTGHQNTLQGARFLSDKQVYLNAGIVLVSEIKRASVAIGTALEVTYLRKDGNTKIYSIALLG